MTDDTLTQAQRNQSLAAIIGTAFGVGVAVGAIVPLVSLSLARDGYDGVRIGINSAMLPLAVMLMGPLMPRIIARLGTLPSIYLGLGVAAIGVLLFPIFPNYYAWCAIRFLIGLASAIHWITSETWINLMATSRSRSRVMSIYASVMALGFVLGPMVINLTGIDGWLPFFAVSVALCVALLPVALARQVVPAVSVHGTVSVTAAFAAAPTVMMAALVAGFVDASLFALIPVYELRAGFDRALAVASLSIFMAGNLILQLPLGWLADHTSRRGVLLLSAGVVAAGAVVYPLLLGSLPLLWLMMFLWGGVSWGIYTLGLALMGERVPAGQLAVANSAFVMMYELGSFGGPILAGGAMDTWPRFGMPTVIAVAAATLLVFGLVRNHRH
ncbi:MAG: MFS transporter [Dongiaceae bacterium]